jgi:hypothetical protein
MAETAESINAGRNPPRGTRRSLAVFLITMVAIAIASVPRLDGFGVFLGALVAFGVTEVLGHRFPEGVSLRWLFRPNLTTFGAATALFLTSVYLLGHVGATCIEGGTVVGFPFWFFVQCNSPGGIDPAQVSVVGLTLDLLIWYFMGTLLASLVRPRKPALLFVE